MPKKQAKLFTIIKSFDTSSYYPEGSSPLLHFPIRLIIASDCLTTHFPPIHSSVLPSHDVRLFICSTNRCYDRRCLNNHPVPLSLKSDRIVDPFDAVLNATSEREPSHANDTCLFNCFSEESRSGRDGWDKYKITHLLLRLGKVDFPYYPYCIGKRIIMNMGGCCWHRIVYICTTCLLIMLSTSRTEGWFSVRGLRQVKCR